MKKYIYIITLMISFTFILCSCSSSNSSTQTAASNDSSKEFNTQQNTSENKKTSHLDENAKIKITSSQIIEGLKPYGFTISNQKVGDQNNIVAQDPLKLVTVYMVGNPNDLTNVSLQTKKYASAETKSYIKRVLELALPQWKDSSKWVQEYFDDDFITTTTDFPQRKVLYGDRYVLLNAMKSQTTVSMIIAYINQN